MARTPKAQPSPDAATGEAPVPVRRGRKAKDGAPSPEAPPTAGGDTAASDGDPNAGAAATGEPPRRRGPNRKPKPPGTAAAAPPRQEQTKQGRRVQASRQLDVGTPQGAAESGGGQDAAAASPPAAAASADPGQMDAGLGAPSDDAQQPSPGLHAPAPAQPAAHWDRATDTVRFNWPAIERTAAANGANQGMAKLLVAARAEGAHSRWPL